MSPRRTVPRKCTFCDCDFLAQKDNPGLFCTRECHRLWKHAQIVPRFWANVVKTEGCWIWTGALEISGYGQLSTRHPPGGSKRSNRIAWTLLRGKIPDGMCVCHTCDNRLCVNPDHLFLGSSPDNTRDKTEKGRQARGETHGNAVFTEADIRNIRALRAAGIGSTPLARRFNTNRTTIKRIVSRKSWAHVA